MNELQVFKSAEFGTIRTVELDGTVWFVGKDVAEILGYTNPSEALADHVDEEDKLNSKTLSSFNLDLGQRGGWLINESGLYSLVLSSKLPSAKKFKRWVTSEVLPSIRKTGAYAVPKDYPSALRALADAEEQKMKLMAENQRQAQAIADFEPIRQYVDEILESPSAMATSQVAADYNLSAKALNKILFEAGIQHSVNGQWILYKRYMGRGLSKSKTIPIVRSDGSRDARILTQWTQKGRLLIHEILTAKGITAVMDRGEGQLCLE